MSNDGIRETRRGRRSGTRKGNRHCRGVAIACRIAAIKGIDRNTMDTCNSPPH